MATAHLINGKPPLLMGKSTIDECWDLYDPYDEHKYGLIVVDDG